MIDWFIYNSIPVSPFWVLYKTFSTIISHCSFVGGATLPQFLVIAFFLLAIILIKYLLLTEIKYHTTLRNLISQYLHKHNYFLTLPKKHESDRHQTIYTPADISDVSAAVYFSLLDGSDFSMSPRPLISGVSSTCFASATRALAVLWQK